MPRPSKHEQIEALYLSGKIEREIALETNTSVSQTRKIISEIIRKLDEIKVNRVDQLKNMEKTLFYKIEEEKASGTRNPALDSFAYAYSTFLLY